MAGESYGVRYSFTVIPVHLHLSNSFSFTQGRYIPLFAAEIYDQNAKLEGAGLTPINLTSVIIGMVFVQSIDQLRLTAVIVCKGNGLTDFATMIPSYYDMTCTPASVPPIFDIS